MSLGEKKNNAKVLLLQVVDAILYWLKTGCQWRELPCKQFFEVEYSWNSVYQHFLIGVKMVVGKTLKKDSLPSIKTD